MDCIFCKIADKKITSKVVFEDKDVFAFEDINPQAPVHVLLIPKLHVSTLLDLDEKNSSILPKLYLAACNIAKQKGISESGFRIVANCNADAGQSVFHIHLHLLGGRRFSWPPG